MRLPIKSAKNNGDRLTRMNVKPLRDFVPPIGGIQAFFQPFQKGLSYPQWPEKR
jgi:hypothetical protein